MPTLILVAYATKHGSTGEVAEAIAATLHRGDFTVDVKPAADVHNIDAYSGVVLGGALYMGRWHRDAVGFLDHFAVALDDKILAVYAMGPLDLDDKDVSGSRKQLDHALAKTPTAEPDSIAIFGGVLDPSEHRFPFNHLPAGDARDWGDIDRWARELGGLFRYGKPAPEAVDPRTELQQTPR